MDKIGEISTEYAEWYREYKRHPIHEVPFNIAYLANHKELKKYAQRIRDLVFKLEEGQAERASISAGPELREKAEGGSNG